MVTVQTMVNTVPR